MLTAQFGHGSHFRAVSFTSQKGSRMKKKTQTDYIWICIYMYMYTYIYICVNRHMSDLNKHKLNDKSNNPATLRALAIWNLAPCTSLLQLCNQIPWVSRKSPFAFKPPAICPGYLENEELIVFEVAVSWARLERPRRTYDFQKIHCRFAREPRAEIHRRITLCRPAASTNR